MKLTIDANVIVAAVAGRSRDLLDAALSASTSVVIPAVQAREARRVLIDRIGLAEALVDRALEQIFAEVVVVSPAVIAGNERRARSRLHAAGQSDWPVVAAALATDTAIWSNDRDFFGVGVAVWSTRTIPLAIAEAHDA